MSNFWIKILRSCKKGGQQTIKLEEIKQKFVLIVENKNPYNGLDIIKGNTLTLKR